MNVKKSFIALAWIVTMGIMIQCGFGGAWGDIKPPSMVMPGSDTWEIVKTNITGYATYRIGNLGFYDPDCETVYGRALQNLKENAELQPGQLLINLSYDEVVEKKSFKRVVYVIVRADVAQFKNNVPDPISTDEDTTEEETEPEESAEEEPTSA